MKWLLLLVVMSSNPEVPTLAPSVVALESQAECFAAKLLLTKTLLSMGMTFSIGCGVVDPAAMEEPEEEESAAPGLEKVPTEGGNT